ncbi:MAG: VOC family protein [Candidatus Omnitrophica bacterium]|nr:hypothetical protein [bacterium]NUN94885.1 VOC family protein [Candidatus Omnitrophota bacterium]
MNLKLDHVAVQVSDLSAAIDFYTRTLGLELLFRELDPVHHEAFAFLRLEGGNLELLQRLSEDNSPIPLEARIPEPPYTPHVALATENIEKILEALADRGVPILKGPLEIPGKVKWLYFSDPDGNILEFVEWL